MYCHPSMASEIELSLPVMLALDEHYFFAGSISTEINR